MSAKVRHLLRQTFIRVAAALGTLAGLWAVILFVSGGADATLFGLKISSHEPLRPLFIAAVALSCAMLAGADETLTRWVTTLVRAARVPQPVADVLDRLSRAGHLDRLAVGALAAIALVLSLHLESRAAGGSDSYGYLAEADLFLQGSLKVSQPWVADVPWPNATWTFSPLGFKPAPAPSEVTIAGYRPALSDDPYAIVPTYSPGLPLLMAAAKRLAGNSAMFWIVPLSSAAFILATFGIGCRLGSRRLGTVAAFLVATSPPVIMNSMVTMTDMPVAAAWAVAIYFLMGESIGSAIAGALAFAAAVLIRPNLVPLLSVIGIWLVLRIWNDAPHRWKHAIRALLLLGGAAAGLIWTFAIFWTTYGTPFQSGYGDTAGYFSWSYLGANVRNYSHWLVETQTPVIWLGLAALFVPIARLWPRADRLAVLMCGAFVAANFAEFLIYLVGDGRAYLRFLLPSYPFMMLGLAAVILWSARLSALAGPLVAAMTLVLGGFGIDFAKRNAAFVQWGSADSIELGLLAGRLAEENSVVLAMQHSGAVRYYGGRVTLRWDNITDGWFDRTVTWLSEHGIRTYAMVDDFELSEMRQRFAKEKLAGRFNEPPDAMIGDHKFFDLSRPADQPIVTQTFPLTLGPGDSRPPARYKPLVFKTK